MGADDLTITAGRPFRRLIHVPEARKLWTDVAELEVRAQMRAGKTTEAELIYNLHTFMSWVLDTDDLEIEWTMTGQQTRALHETMLKFNRKGYFNIVISDKGVVDARALVVPVMLLKSVDTTTRADGDT